MLEASKKNDSLPELLAYKIGRGVGEILMTHGGESLEGWNECIKVRKNRIGFMAEMLRQIVPALAFLHQVGYSHGDLKLENICCRTSSSGNFKFTLIDFGMSQKLPQLNKQNRRAPFFLGNYMFASTMQLKKYAPSKLCDLFSLMCVCYYFTDNELPWTDFVDEKMAQDPSVDLYELNTFKKIRLDYDEDFKDKFRSAVTPFGSIFTYLFTLMEK